MSNSSAAAPSALNSFVKAVAKRLSNAIGKQAVNSVEASTAVKNMMTEIVSSAKTLNEAGPILNDLNTQLTEANKEKDELTKQLQSLNAEVDKKKKNAATLKDNLRDTEERAKVDAEAAANAERRKNEEAAAEEAKKKEEAAAQKKAADNAAAKQLDDTMNAIRTQIQEAEAAATAAETEANLAREKVTRLDGNIADLTKKTTDAKVILENAQKAKDDLNARIQAAARTANAEAQILANQTAMGAQNTLASKVGSLRPENISNINAKISAVQPTITADFEKMKIDGLASLKQANQKATAALNAAQAAAKEVTAAAASASSAQQGGRRSLRTLRTLRNKRVLRKRTRKHR